MDGEVKPGRLLGKYRLERVLGRGGMGEVWEAYDPDLDRRVALKLLHARVAGHDDARARFQREGRAMARLRHPNVIAVHDATFSGDRGVIAMELVDGENLASWAATPREPSEIVRVILAAGRGLAAAHAAGMIHRDFKPHNVLIDRDGRVLVTDFGLARSTEVADEPPQDRTGFARTDPPEKLRSWGPEDPALEETAAPGSLEEPSSLEETAARDEPAAPGSLDDTAAAVGATVATESPPRRPSADSRPRIRSAESAARARDQLATPLTETGSLLGTPAYMAPEQLAGDGVDARSDVFAFCVTAWELFAGVRPFPAESLDKILLAVKANVPSAEAKVPRSLRAILRRGFAWEPKDRWQTMDDVLRAIERAWTRPKRIAIASGALVGVGAIAAALVATRSPTTKPAPICDDAAIAIAPAWNDQTRAGLAKSLEGKDYKERTLGFFDHWARVWKSTYEENCRKPNDPEFGARRECLESIRNEVALVTEHSDSLPPEMWALADTPRLIAPPQTCALAPRSLAPAPPPVDVRDAVATIRIQLATKRVPLLSRSPSALLVDATPEIEAARATKYLPVMAEATLLAAMVSYARSIALEQPITCNEFDEPLSLSEKAGYDRMAIEVLLVQQECVDGIPRRAEEAERLLSRLETVVQRTHNPFQRAIVDGLHANAALSSASYDRAIELVTTARATFQEMGVDLWAARSQLVEATARSRRQQGDDLAIAAELMEKARPLAQRSKRAMDRLVAEIAWMRGLPVPAMPLSPDKDAVTIRARVLENGAPVEGASVGTGNPSYMDVRDRALLVEGVDTGSSGTTATDGTVELHVKREKVLVARHRDSIGVTKVSAVGGKVDVSLAPGISVHGTTKGIHDGLLRDPSNLVERAMRRRGRVFLVLQTSSPDPVVFNAPIDASGNWSANVPAGTYLVAAQTKSGLDLQVRQQTIDLRAASEVPTFVFDPAPRIVEVLVRSLSSTAVVAYAAPSNAPFPTTWTALREKLQAATALSAGELAPPRSDDPGTKVGDLIARISAPGETSIVCAIPDGVVLPRVPIVLVNETPDAKDAPVCSRIVADGRVAITGR